MDFDFTPEEEAFRDEVRQFLAENLPPPESRGPDFMKKWLKAVREKRYVGFSWPKEVTGGGGSVIQQFILKEEMTKARAPMLGTDVAALAWVGPAIIQYGTEEQKQKFIPDILDSKSVWCTGYSEPEVGSDLASLQCRAERDGDEYQINRTKIWTSLAQYHKRIYMMVRTDTTTKSRYGGITCLLVPMDTPGIEVQPILNMAGGHVFNQVFFNDVQTPVENRLGEEGQGWMVTVSALQNERSGLVETMSARRSLEGLADLAKRSQGDGKSLRDQHMRRRLAEIEAKVEAMRLNGMRALTKQIRGEVHQSESSLNKLLMGDLLVEMNDLSLELLGTTNQYMGDSEESADGGHWQQGALSWPTTVVGGGAPNIQRNIIAERILGLPKD